MFEKRTKTGESKSNYVWAKRTTPAKKYVNDVIFTLENEKNVVAEDKSLKETWAVPKAKYAAICLWTALIAGWTYFPDLKPDTVEYAIRGYWADALPLRFRRFLGAGMGWKAEKKGGSKGKKEEKRQKEEEAAVLC